MTMTSFPWESKTSQSYPWDKREMSPLPSQNRTETSSYKWQTPQNGAPTYHWQSAAPPGPSGNSGTKYPWESGTSSGNSYLGGSQTNPFDVKKTSFPWEKSAVNSTSKSDLFVFGKEEPKKIGGSYSSFYSEQQKADRDKPPEAKASAGTYSSFYNQSKKSLFPWEKDKESGEKDKKPDPDSLEAQMSAYLKLPSTEGASESNGDLHEKEKGVEIKVEKASEKGSSPKTPKKKSSPKKSPKSGRKKSTSKEEKPETEVSTEEQAPNIEVKVTISSDQEKEEDKLKEEEDVKKTKSPLQKTQAVSQPLADEKDPITSPKIPMTRSSSLTKLAAKAKTDRVKSAPPVPKHINRKSEKLARSYTSAYAKPKIPPKKKDELKEEEKPRLSYRREESISEWVYPAPPEPVDWKTRSEQGLPKEPAPAVPDLATQSELNLDSSSLREAAFQKWIAKKKENNTFKKADLVTVIDDKEEMPSAEEIRQKRFEEWYRARAVEADKKSKEQKKTEVATKTAAEELKEQKAKDEANARRLWEEKDKERKRKIREKRLDEEKKRVEEANKLEEKKKNADKTFSNWKTNKDPKIKEEARKKRMEEKQRKEQERDEKEMKEIESQKSFKAWKEAKDQEIRDKKAQEDRIRQQKEQLEIRKKREKEEATARAVQEWNAQKERDESKINIPQHISPWKNGPGKKAVVSRDEMIMANIKHKKNRQRHGSGRGPKSMCDSETVTEVEFVK